MYFLDDHFLAFIPALVCVYWIAGNRLRNWVLLAGNIGWLTVFSLPTLLALSTISLAIIYPVSALAQRRAQAGQPERANQIGWFGVFAVIAVTVALRLKDYWLDDGLVDGSLLRWIGFSYFILKAVHVMRATARGIVALPTPLTILQYVLFLPTLTSGPIYRVDVFAQQLAEPKRPTWEAIHDGAVRILLGIGKKVVFAKPLSKLTVALHAGSTSQPAAYVLTYVVLYLDFSGYTDMAIGMGRLLGFSVPENFKNPFTATTLTQFWRNWHATLGDWLRENVFLPMGGMRAKGPRLWAIVVSSMLVVGLWHAFRPVFVLWGLYHGLLLLIEHWLDVKPLRPYRTPKWRLFARYALVQVAVMGGMFAFIGADFG